MNKIEKGIPPIKRPPVQPQLEKSIQQGQTVKADEKAKVVGSGIQRVESAVKSVDGEPVDIKAGVAAVNEVNEKKEDGIKNIPEKVGDFSVKEDKVEAISEKAENSLATEDEVLKFTKPLNSLYEHFTDLVKNANEDFTGADKGLEIPDSSSEIKLIIDNFEERDKELEATVKEYWKIIKDAIGKLEKSKLTAPSDLPGFEFLITTAIQAAAAARKAEAERKFLVEQFNATQPKFAQVRVQEAGFDSFDAVAKHRRQVTDELYPLYRKFLGLGKYFYKEKLQRLEQENDKLQEILSLKNSFVGKYYHNPHEYDLERVEGFISRSIVSNIKDFSDLAMAELSQTEHGKNIELSPALADELNDSYIDTYVSPAIEAEYIKSSRKTKEMQRQTEQGILLLKQAFALPSNIAWNDEEKQRKRKAIYDDMQKLPSSLRYVLDRFSRGEDERYQTVFDLIAETSNKQKISKIETVRKNWSEKLQKLLEGKKGGHDFRSNLYRLGEINEARLRSFLTVDEINNIDSDRYRIATKNSKVIEHFGKDRIGKAEKCIEESALRQLFAERSHSDTSVRMGSVLEEFGSVDSLPVFILNAYREPGYSGEQPFLRHDASSGRNVLVEQIEKFGEEKLESLKKLQVPGLTEVIDLIRKNPKKFNSYGEYKGEGAEREFEENPINQEIQKNLAKIIEYYFKNGGTEMEQFLAETCERLDADLGESYSHLERLLQSPRESVRAVVIDSLIRRSQGYDKQDIRAAEILLRNYSIVTGDEKSKIRKGATEMIFSLLPKDEKAAQNFIPIIATVIGKEERQVKTLCDLLTELGESGTFRISVINTPNEELEKFFDLAENADTRDLIIGLSKRGYQLSIGDFSTLLQISPDRQKIFTDIDEIRNIQPDFCYSPINLYTTQDDKVISDPYGIFAHRIISANKPEEEIAAILSSTNEQIKRRFSKALLLGLRTTDPALKEIPQLPEVTESKINTFREAFEKLQRESSRPDSVVSKYKDFFFNKHSLYYLSRQPERIDEALEIPMKAPRLFSELLALGGPLYTNRDLVMADIWNNGDALRRAEEIETIFERKLPYWRSIYLFTRSRLGDKLSAASTEYPIETVGQINFSQLLERHNEQKIGNPNKITRLEALVNDRSMIAELINGKRKQVPFRALSGSAKHIVFRDYLRRTVELSRDLKAKTIADSRNRQEVIEPLKFKPGTYIHGSSVDFARQMFLNGNLPGEALGESARADSYPFQVDFSCMTEDYLKTYQAIKDSIGQSISGGYGGAGKLGENGKIIYVYDRSQTAWDPGVEYNTGNKNHTLVLGGMPATEITSIVLRSPDSTLNQMKKLVLENGFYIPLYDFDGKLLFTPAEFDEMYQDFNMSASVEIFDNSFKTGEQRGSNAGGEYTVPTEKGPIKYYVKFEKPEGADHLWNEQLADNIYRTMDISVPNTRVVAVDGSIGHASQIINGREVAKTEFYKLLKGGFVVDCLLANWDMPAKTDNSLVGDDGKLLRIDNGGSLLFRAQGTRKEGFGEVVLELETMRYGYEGIIKKEIIEQIENLKQKLTNEVIDELVDGVRLRNNDRDYLKSILRKRRDYIIEYYTGEKENKNKKISEKGKMLETLLKESEIDDKRLSVVVKEWERVSGQEGYQHNQVSLGEHIKDAVKYLSSSAEFKELNENEQNIALVAMLFHDIAKPTGKKGTNIPRDFSHEVPSAAIAAQYMRKWGYSMADIAIVAKIIMNDGVASDMARNKVRDQAKKTSPTEFSKQLGPKVLRILKLVNKADVVATVGEKGFKLIEKEYNKYF